MFSVFFPARSSFAAILPSFLIFPATDMFLEVSTAPLFSSFPETVIFPFALTFPDVTRSSDETVPTAVISLVFLTFLAFILPFAMITPSLLKLSTFTFLEAIVPEEAVSLPVKSPFEAILPVFLIFPDTFTSSAVSTAPSFSSFPATVIDLFAFTVPEVDISSLETVPAAAISPVFVTFLPLKLPPASILPVLPISPETITFFEVSSVPPLSSLPLIERSSLVLKAPEDFRLSAEILPTTVISPVLETFLAVKSLLATILPSFLRFPVLKLFETTVPEVSIFFEVKSPLVRISPEFNTFPATDMSFEAPTVPLLSRSPLISRVSFV